VDHVILTSEPGQVQLRKSLKKQRVSLWGFGWSALSIPLLPGYCLVKVWEETEGMPRGILAYLSLGFDLYALLQLLIL
jgi:hypothetical protein